MGKTILAIVATLSLLLSFFAIAQPVAAEHGGAHLQESQRGTAFDDADQNANCPAGDLERIEPGETLWHFVLTDPGADSGTLTATFEDAEGHQTTVTQASEPRQGNGALHFYVVTDTGLTLVDAETDIGGGNLVLSHICNEAPVVGSLIVLKTDDQDPATPLPGAEFTVGEVTQTTGADGTTCFDGLVAGDSYDVTETTPPAGYEPADPATQSVVAGSGTCADRTDGPDVTFTNALIPGSLIVLKTDDQDPATPLPGAEFTVGEVTQTTGADGTTCFDGLVAGDSYDVTETTPPAGYEPADPATQSVVAGSGTCADRTDGPDVTFTNALIPGEGTLEVDKLICLAETSSTDFDVSHVGIQAFNAEEESGDVLEDIGDCILGANVTFEVYVDANGNGELDEGEMLSADADLADGTLTTNENGAITIDLAEGNYILVEAAGGIEQGNWPGGSVAFSIVDGELTLIEVTNNIAEEGENGLLKIRKFFCDTSAPEGFDNPDFIELEGPEADTDASLPDQFAENCSRGGDNPEATFEIDGNEFVTEDGILVVSLPAGEHDVVETDPNEGSTTVTIEVDGTTSLLVLNFLPEQEQLGSITVQKEIQCEVCETFTPGFYFNQGENNEGSAFAQASLSANPIIIGGMTFDSVQSVQDNAAPGSLLRHYLALVLNVRMGTADECDLAAVTYSGSMEAFEGMTIGEILDEAEAVLNGGSSEFTAEELHDVIDEINNSDAGDDTLSCSGTTGLAGFDFVLTDAEDMEHNATTDADGMIVFDDLPLGTYTLEETGGPEGSDCMVVSASGDGVDFDAETGVITITLTADMADVTVTVVNDCGGEGGEETELGSITILKNALPDDAQDFAFTTMGTGLSGFSLDDDADATLSNQKTFMSLAAGNYSVTESATEGWDLTSITCSAGGTADLANGTANITLAEGANVTCTFVNTMQGGQQAETGSITILKNAVPDNAQDFAFTTTGTGLSGFSLDDDADATLSNQKTFTGLAAGMYTVAEGSVSGWVLASLTCSPSAAVSIGGSTATINLAAGANVTCTFVNNRSGSGTLPNQGGPGGQTVTPRQGTLAGNLPNTATEPFNGTSMPVALVALLMLSGLGAAAYAVKAEASRRR